jgi:hypothetical protein
MQTSSTRLCVVGDVFATLNTAYIVGHTIFSTLYSVGKLDEQ